jgi:hypothetical protein
MIDRRSFLRTIVGGVAAGAAVRTWPFRVYSFPSKVIPWFSADFGFGDKSDAMGVFKSYDGIIWQIWGKPAGESEPRVLDEICTQSGEPIRFGVPPGTIITAINNKGLITKPFDIPLIEAYELFPNPNDNKFKTYNEILSSLK